MTEKCTSYESVKELPQLSRAFNSVEDQDIQRFSYKEIY